MNMVQHLSNSHSNFEKNHKILNLYPEIKGLISIVIPTYNAATYIVKTLDSIYAQTYTSFEIIVAYETNSTDNTLELLNNYAQTHKITIDIGSESRAGLTRNRGARLAKGEFIIFIDSDDLLYPTYLADMMSVYYQNPELNVVCGNVVSVNESGVDKYIETISKIKNTIILYDTDKVIKDIFVDRTFPLGRGPWIWLAKRKYMENNNISFPPYQVHNDAAFVAKLLINTDIIGQSTKPGYIYIGHENTLCRKEVTTETVWDRYMLMTNDVYNILSKKNKNLARLVFISEFEVLKVRIVLNSAKKTYKKYIYELKKYRIFNISRFYGDTSISKISKFCFNHSKWLYWVFSNVFLVLRRFLGSL